MGLLSGLLSPSPTKDAQKILDAIDYRVLRVAWETFVEFRDHHDEDDNFKIATPAWLALQVVVNNEGFENFEPHEQKFLGILQRAPQVYREVVEVLENANYTDADAERAFESHHDLADVITPEFQEYRRKEVKTIFIEVAKAYRDELEGFIRKHGGAIEREMATLQVGG